MFGLTTPLLLTQNGEKFGKTAGNAIFIDPESDKSLLAIHQYLMGLPDSEIGTLLRLTTFMDPEKIMEIELAIEQGNIDKLEARP